MTAALRHKRTSDAVYLDDHDAGRPPDSSSSKRTKVAAGSGSSAKANKAQPTSQVQGAKGPAPRRRVYCDGSSRGNGKKGAVAGIGVFWSHEEGAP